MSFLLNPRARRGRAFSDSARISRVVDEATSPSLLDSLPRPLPFSAFCLPVVAKPMAGVGVHTTNSQFHTGAQLGMEMSRWYRVKYGILNHTVYGSNVNFEIRLLFNQN